MTPREVSELLDQNAARAPYFHDEVSGPLASAIDPKHVTSADSAGRRSLLRM
jgi:hypothetical protein